MAISKTRKKVPGRGKQVQHNRKLFLPMERAAANEIMLHCRLALEAIRQGRGDKASAHCLAQAVLLTGHLTHAGYGDLKVEWLDETERALLSQIGHGGATSEWHFHDSLIEDLTAVVNEYDRILSVTRLQAVVEASEWLDRVLAKKITAASIIEG